jgi:hypothetical protein
MRDLRLGTVGHIDQGIDIGRYVEVLDDFDVSGGYLIVTYDRPDRLGNAYDSWVESIVDVELYFDEAGWEISWLDS